MKLFITKILICILWRNFEDGYLVLGFWGICLEGLKNYFSYTLLGDDVYVNIFDIEVDIIMG